MKDLRWFFFKHPLLVLVLFVGAFSNAPLLSANIFGLPGMKIFNLLSLALMISWALKGGRIIHLRGTIETKAMLCLFAVVFVYSFEFFRALSNYDLIENRFIGVLPDTPIGFFFSFWVKNILYIIPFIYILQHISHKREINALFAFLIASFLFFDIVSISATYNVTTSGLDREALLVVCLNTFGLHYNNVSTLIMIGVPMAMGVMLQFGMKYSWVLLIMLISLVFAGSRGAMLGAVVGILFVLLSNGKINLKLIVGLIILMFPMAFFSNQLTDLFGSGVAEGDAYQMTSGRMSALWIPLLNELFDDGYKLFFGFGLLGTVQTDAYVFNPYFFQANHAHNAYINLLVNGGLLVFVPFGLMIFIFIKRAIRLGKGIAEPMYYGLIGSMVAYLVASFSGRHFLIDFDNMLLFPVIALIVVYMQMEKLRSNDDPD